MPSPARPDKSACAARALGVVSRAFLAMIYPTWITIEVDHSTPWARCSIAAHALALIKARDRAGLAPSLSPATTKSVCS
jgi:hypothetical protein